MARIKWVSEAKLERLQDVLDAELRSERKLRRQNAAGVLLGLLGLRVGEAREVRCEHLDTDNHTLYVPPFKRGNERVIELTAELSAALAKVAELSGSVWLLSTRTGKQVDHKRLQDAQKRLLKRAVGAETDYTFHALRHSYAMRVLRATRDLSLVQQKLGHKSITSTEIYARSLARVPDSALPRLGRPAEEKPPAFLQLRIFDAQSEAG
jgi:integrase